jgi:cell shape-determining protein MreC
VDYSYDEICKHVGALYLNLSHKLDERTDQLSQTLAKMQAVESENQRLKEHLKKVANE